jgi:hypothetical protein
MLLLESKYAIVSSDILAPLVQWSSDWPLFCFSVLFFLDPSFGSIPQLLLQEKKRQKSKMANHLTTAPKGPKLHSKQLCIYTPTMT